MHNHKIEIYIPRNTNEQELTMTAVFESFCQKFGGATVIPSLSGWIDNKGNLVTNKIGIIYSYVPEVTKEIEKFLKGLAVEVRESLKEDAITLIIDNKADFY